MNVELLTAKVSTTLLHKPRDSCRRRQKVPTLLSGIPNGCHNEMEGRDASPEAELSGSFMTSRCSVRGRKL